MSNILMKYQQKQELLAAYQLALTTMHWDQATIAPKNGSSYANKMAGMLAGESFSLFTDPAYRELIVTLLDDLSLSFDLKVEMQQQLKIIDQIKDVPKAEYIEYQQLCRDAEVIWEKAKDQNDFQLFKPTLQKLIDQTKKMVSYRNSDLDVYSSLIDDFETGITIAQYDAFFENVKAQLVPFIKKIQQTNTAKPELLSIEVAIEKQQQVIDLLKVALCVDDQSSYHATSAHPFSSSFSILDNRVTVKYHPKMFLSSIFAYIHEVGHATYNGQVDIKYDGRSIANSMTYGMHESQSRLYENNLGRNQCFWEPLYPKMQEIIEPLQSYTLEEFILAINFVENSLIRIEADELTYPLHIIIRYEIEKELFNGSLTVDQLPQVWNQKMKEYLDIDVPNDALGVLQDIHWSSGAFGYFPTYAYGSALACRFEATMKDQIDVYHALANNNFKIIKDWLKINIHQHGGLYTPNQLCQMITNQPFNAQYYIDYLINKYSKLYGLT